MPNAFQISGKIQLQQGNLQAMAARIHKTLTNAGSVSIPVKMPGLVQANQQLAKLKQNLASVRGAAASVGGLTPQFNAVSRSAAAASKAAGSFSSSIASSTKSIAAFSIGAGSLLAVLGKVKEGIGEAIGAQDAFVKIEQTSGKTQKQLGSLKRTVTGLSTAWGVNSGELIDVSRTLLQAGIDASKTEKALSTLAKTSPQLAAGMGSLRNQTEAAIAVMGQFGTGVEKLEGQFGGINAVSKKFAVESEDLTKVIRIAGGTWKAAGGDLNSLIGAFTAIRSKTRESASSIANGLKTITARLQRGSTRKKLSDMLGIDLAENGQFNKPLEAIGKIAAAVRSLPEGSLLLGATAETAAGVRQLGKFIPLVRGYATALEAEQVAQGGANSLLRDAMTAQGSLAVQISKTREQWRALYRDLVDSSGFKTTVKALLSISSAAAKVADALIPLMPALTALAGIKLGKAAFGALPKLLGKNSGGIIPGVGNRDTVPAMLTPGEVVLSKTAVKALGGSAAADRLNHIRGYNAGGVVGGSRSVGTYALADASSGVKRFADALKKAVEVVHDESTKVKSQRAGSGLEKGNHPGYALAGDTPNNFAPGSRYYRRMSRSDREARIVDMGYGGRLANIRRSALQQGQQTYLEHIGLGGQTAGTSLARKAGMLTGRTTSFLKSGISRLGLNGQHAMFAAGAAALHPGTEHFVSSIAGDKAGKAFSGGASAALVGGAVAGPWGALAAGALGAVKALEGFEKNLLSDKIEQGFSRIESASSELADALSASGGKLTQGVLDKANSLDAGRMAVRGHIERFKGASEASMSESYGHVLSGLGGGFMNLFDSTQGSLGQRWSKGYNAPRLAAEKARQQEITTKELGHLEKSAGSDSALRLGLLSQSKHVGDYGRSLRGQEIQQNQARTSVLGKEMTGEYNSADRIKNLALETKLIRQRDAAEEKANLAVRQNTAAIDAFARSAAAATSAVDQISAKFADLQNASKSTDNANALLTGATGSGPASLDLSRHSTALNRFGSAGFEAAAAALGRAHPAMAPAAGLVANANRAHGALTQITPDILKNHDIMTEQGFNNARLNFGQAMELNGVHPQMRHEALARFDKMKTDNQLRDYASGTNNAGLVQNLVSTPEVKAAQSALVSGSQAHEGAQQRSLANFGQYHQLRNAAGEASDQAASMRLHSQQIIAQQKAERFGGHATDYLTHADFQRPTLQRQQRLTGLPGQQALNPHAVMGRIQQLHGQVQNARMKVESKQGGDQAVADLRKFESELQNAVRGLTELTDSSKLTAGAVERLSHLQGDKNARLGHAERYLTASTAEKRQMDLSARLAKQAATHGIESIKKPEHRKLALQFMHEAGDATLFGGKLTGPQMAKQAVEKSATYQQHFKNKAGQAQIDQIQGLQVAGAQNAAAAQGLLANHAAGVANQVGANIGAFKLPTPQEMMGFQPVPKPEGPMVMRPAEPVADTRTPGQMRQIGRAARATMGGEMKALRGKLADASTPDERKNILSQMAGKRSEISGVKNLLSSSRMTPQQPAKRQAYDAGKAARRDAYNQRRGISTGGAGGLRQERKRTGGRIS